MTTRLTLVGYGKIAADQHLPAITADPRFELAGVSTRSRNPELGVPWFATPGEMFVGLRGQAAAVAICTPPEVRHAIAKAALAAGLDVLLEKPPAATVGALDDLARQAEEAGRVLFTAWHSQHAAGVEAARAALAGQGIAEVRVNWREDVRKWHPGQDWVWEPQGFGVFDPGINALSILTRILPVPLLIDDARLSVPANRQTPIAVSLRFAGLGGAEFDWRHSEHEEWVIEVRTERGRQVRLEGGGAKLFVDGAEQPLDGRGEYPALYAHFAELLAARRSFVDREPLRMVADALLLATREPVEPFDWS